MAEPIRTDAQRCERCNGSGRVPIDGEWNPRTGNCPDCKGTGEAPTERTYWQKTHGAERERIARLEKALEAVLKVGDDCDCIICCQVITICERVIREARGQ